MTESRREGHTPGPWRIERSPIRRTLCIFGGPEFDTWICGELQSDNETRIDTSEVVANAHLIAAAPFMLTALKLYAAEFPEDQGALARRAIAMVEEEGP